MTGFPVIGSLKHNEATRDWYVKPRAEKEVGGAISMAVLKPENSQSQEELWL